MQEFDFGLAVQEAHNKEGYGSPMLTLVMAGGGTEAIGELLRHGRGSKTLLSAHVLYSRRSFDAFLGRRPDSYVNDAVARQLAMQAYRHSQKELDEDSSSSLPAGISCTTTLAKAGGEREGRRHEVYVAVQTPTHARAVRASLVARRAREAEERICAKLVLQEIVRLKGVKTSVLSPANLAPEDVYEAQTIQANPHVYPVWNGQADVATIAPDGETLGEKYAAFAGSFNPYHEGHYNMQQHAQKVLGLPVVCEISIANADKPPMDFFEIEGRLSQFRLFDQPVIVTRHALFTEKARVLPKNTTFVVGYDTFERIGNPIYYRGDVFPRLPQYFHHYGTKFLVFARHGRGKDRATEAAHPLIDTATWVSVNEFSDSTSSTAIRNAQTKPETDTCDGCGRRHHALGRLPGAPMYCLACDVERL
jgi:nicotinic acid mononucleotide adenylyltransferase